MRIYKYELVPNKTCHTYVEMPTIRKPISVGEQDNRLIVWAEVDEHDKAFMSAYFYVIPTGFKELPNADIKFIGTVQMSSGLVFHIYWDRDWE